MTIEELKELCKRQVLQFERVEKIMPVTPNDWKRYEEHMLILELLEQESCEDVVSRKRLLSGIDELMQSPWFNNGKDDDTITHYGYVERKEAVEIVRDMCVKAEPPVIPKQRLCKDCKFFEYDSAKNMKLYGEDITEKWLTVTQNASALEKAYRKGYYDAFGSFRSKEKRKCTSSA